MRSYSPLRRLSHRRILLAAILAGLAGWFACTTGVGRLPGAWFVSATIGGLALFVASMLRLAHRSMATSPSGGLRPLAAHAEILILLLTINLVILSPLAPLFEVFGTAATASNPVSRYAFVALGKLTGPVLGALFVAGALLVAWMLVLRLFQPILRLGLFRGMTGALNWLVVAGVVLFCAGSITLSYNSSLDHGPASPRRADLVAVAGLRIPLTGLTLGWADVRYVDEPRGVERLMLVPDDEVWPQRAAPGLPLRVDMRPGVFGLPWIQRVAVDRERDLQRTLAAVPTAAALRQTLISSLAQQRRWNEVLAETERHARMHPEDRQFVLGVVAALRAEGQASHALALEHLVRQP